MPEEMNLGTLLDSYAKVLRGQSPHQANGGGCGNDVLRNSSAAPRA